jgi:hypothetical protein
VTEKMEFLTFCAEKFSACNFFGVIFSVFSTDSNSASNFEIYDTHIKFLAQTFLGVLFALFANFELEFGKNGSKNPSFFPPLAP